MEVRSGAAGCMVPLFFLGAVGFATYKFTAYGISLSAVHAAELKLKGALDAHGGRGKIAYASAKTPANPQATIVRDAIGR